MKGFIEVTDKTDNTKLLLPVDKIVDVQCETDGSTFIDMVVNSRGETLGVATVETYDTIKQLLTLAR